MTAGRAFTSGHQSAARKVLHAPAAANDRVNALCGMQNTSQTVRSANGQHMMTWGCSPSIWKGDKAELMVTCKACRRAMGL